MTHLADQINHLDRVSLNRSIARKCLYQDRSDKMFQTHTALRFETDTNRTEWVDDVSKWPSVDYGCIYTDFINTPGMYIAEALKSYRSLAPYHAAHVQTVVYLACMWCIMHVTADIKKIP